MIYATWTTEQKNDGDRVDARHTACYADFRRECLDGNYIYTVIHPKFADGNHAEVLKNALEYMNTHMPSRVIRDDKNRLLIEVAYTPDVEQDKIFFVLCMARYMADEFYKAGYDGESFREYLHHVLLYNPAHDGQHPIALHTPLRRGSGFNDNPLNKDEVLSYWFDGEMKWRGPSISEHACGYGSYQSFNEDDVRGFLAARNK